jgi:hypothetical protein
MVCIARILPLLDDTAQPFHVEALAGVIKPRWIEDALRIAGRQSRRRRLLPASLALWILILLALFRRHSCANVLGMLAGSAWAKRHWPQGKPPSDSALTQARDRLGLEPVRLLFDRSAETFFREAPGRYLADRRLVSLDGVVGHTPDSDENRKHFGSQPCDRGPTGAYPMLRAVVLVDVGSRMVVGVRYGPYATSEMTLAREMLPQMPAQAIVCMDRNFPSFSFLWALHEQKTDFIVRVKQRMTGKTIRRLGPHDRLIRVRLRGVRGRQPDLPETWTLREVTFRPRRGYEAIRVYTSLRDPVEAPAGDVARAYAARWEEEVAFDEIKTHLLDRTTVNRPVLFRGQTPMRVEQELYATFIAYNAIRMLLSKAAGIVGTTPDRLSFTVGLERIREAVRDMSADRTVNLPRRYQELLRALTHMRVRKRPGRSNPREVKIKMSSYLRKRSPHAA